MIKQAALPQLEPAENDEPNAKRRQIIDGARAIFLAEGFDAASMNDIARAAGVSKGTLYVYFENKEELFEPSSKRSATSRPKASSISTRTVTTSKRC